MEKIVLAYSGGLDTSVMIKWLEERFSAEVITVTVDVGQQEDLTTIEQRAKSIGVRSHYTLDGKSEFVERFIQPAIQANALYEDKYPLCSALSRPLIALKLIEVARKVKATAVAHGSTGKGNDQVRFEVTLKALAPELKVLAPARSWGLSREQEIGYALKRNIPFSKTKSKYSIDQNLWGRSIECGPLEQPDLEPPEEVFEWTRDPKSCPDTPAYLTLQFDEGVLSGVDGREMDRVEAIRLLNRRAGEHGIGRIDHMEDRLVGIKSREVYECPAAVCLIEAHKDLEKAVLTRHELQFKKLVDDLWTWLIYCGLWADPLREALEAFIAVTQKRVTGDVKLKLYKGALRVVGRNSPNSLYNLKLATYEASSEFKQEMAEGFVELWGLPSRLARLIKERQPHKF